VTWENRDPFPHTVTSAGHFDSGSIAAGAHWRYVATKPGTFEYICTFHPNMKGRLVVECFWNSVRKIGTQSNFPSGGKSDCVPIFSF